MGAERRRLIMIISAEAREWAIEQIKAHGEYSSLDDLLQQAETLAQKYVRGGEDGSPSA
jgi:hypothetical protein